MNFSSFLRQLAGTFFQFDPGPVKSQLNISSKYLKRKVELIVYRSPVFPGKPMRLLICNDGQDLERMNIAATLTTYNRRFPKQPMLFVGVVAGDRLREYGTAGKPDYKQRGDLAYAHEQFVLNELLPMLERQFTLRPEAIYRAVAGFSLGGLNAFDLVWRNPEHFATAAVFSGALWWRSAPFKEADPDADRIVHTYVEEADAAPTNFRCWLMAGTEDEESDRNGNGIIDAIDDTLQLMQLLKRKGLQQANSITYLEVAGGRHEPTTWGKVMPDFLSWWVRAKS